MTANRDNVADAQRFVSLQLLQSVSCFAMRTPRGQKDPGVVNWDPRTNSLEKSRQTIETLRNTNDNPAIHLFGSVVDVDVDVDNPFLVAALDHFLPPTPHVWGRGARKRTHRLYELSGCQNNTFNPADYPFLARLTGHPLVGLEVRGGEMRSGRYTLLPGAIHPSGEPYQWDDISAAQATPTLVAERRVMDGVRFACAAALIAPYWTEGVRNQLCMAFSGFLFKATQYSLELSDDDLFDKDTARRLLEGLMEIAGDDKADYAMRMKTFEQTWDKATRGEPTSGATRIAEITGDASIVPTLYALLAHTEEVQKLEALFEQYVTQRNSTNVIDLHEGADGAYVMDHAAFRATMAGNYLTTAKGRKPVADIFLNSPQRVAVNRVSMHPSKPRVFQDDNGAKIANIWNGWGVDPCSDDVAPDQVAPFTDYLFRVVCSSDVPLYTWVLTWVADIFQDPANKPGTALVLVGSHGAGKSFLGESILRPIIGRACYAKTGSAERLTAKFNATMGGKLLIQGEEVMSSRRRHDANILKDAITSPFREVEHKGRDPLIMDDFARYLFTSNHRDDAVAIETEDRRYTIIEVNPMYSESSVLPKDERRKYWQDLVAWVSDRDNLAKLHKYFLTLPPNKELIRSPITTAAKRRTFEASSFGIDGWLLSLLEMSNPFERLSDSEKGYEHSIVYDKKNARYRSVVGWPEFVQYSLVELAVNRHMKRRYEKEISAQAVARHFKDNNLVRSTDYVQTVINGARKRLRPFPSLESISAYLTLRGYDIEPRAAENEDSAETPGPDF